MVTARYAGFLQRSLPPFWATTDREKVLAALSRLDAMAPPPEPVAEPAARGLGGASPMVVTDLRPKAGPPPVPESPRTAVTQGHAWTPAQDAELRDAVEAGIDLEDLVDHFELPETAIAARLEQLGLDLGDPQLGF